VEACRRVALGRRPLLPRRLRSPSAVGTAAMHGLSPRRAGLSHAAFARCAVLGDGAIARCHPARRRHRSRAAREQGPRARRP
jgi:hypothetical protein